MLRDGPGLDTAASGVADLLTAVDDEPRTENWEITNLLTVAAALVTAARNREETRGAHWRDDFPERDDTRWRGHLLTTLTADGLLRTDFAPL